jgi:deazaflavin-dependent oxidoreductase (nitroreductase family)
MSREYKAEFFYMVTTGRKTGNPHEIEIWYVERGGNYYLVAEHGENAHWVKNIQHQPEVKFRVGLGDWQAGTARAVDRHTEMALAGEVAALMDAKYDWSDGLIVEISPNSP